MGLFSRKRTMVKTERESARESEPGPPDGVVRAVWNGTVIAESRNTVVVEGKHYFPPEDVSDGYLADSSKESVCHWKGTAAYHDIVVDGETNPEGAWYYPEPKQKAAQIKDHVAFWRGVEVEGG